MNYLQDKKIKKKKYLNIFLIILATAILFYFSSGIYNTSSYISSIVFRPVVVLGNNMGNKFKNLGSYFSSKSRLVNENEKLSQDLADARARVLNYDIVLGENSEFKETLGRKAKDSSMVFSAILSKPNKSPYDTLVIDVSTGHGVTVGNIVFAYGDVPVGRISEVGYATSKVTLFTNSGEKTPAILERNSNSSPVPSPDTEATDSSLVAEVSTPSEEAKVFSQGGKIFVDLVGRGGGNFEMNLPIDEKIYPNDKVTIPGMHPFVVAIVEKVISDPRDAFQKVLLTSPVNIQELKFVEVAI